MSTHSSSVQTHRIPPMHAGVMVMTTSAAYGHWFKPLIYVRVSNSNYVTLTSKFQDIDMAITH
jgi:hypothetical protein